MCPTGTSARLPRSFAPSRYRPPHVRGEGTVCNTDVEQDHGASDCGKTTFAEQLTGLTARHARHSVPARQVLTTIALAVGGRAGQRLTGHLGVPCPETLVS